jgi:hypothetical protein
MATRSETSYLLVGLVAQSVISAADMQEQRMAATKETSSDMLSGGSQNFGLEPIFNYSKIKILIIKQKEFHERRHNL